MNNCLNCGYEFEDTGSIICPICMKIYCEEYNNIESFNKEKGEKDVTIE